jgi:RNA polymerase-binding transcription factor DksA
VTDESSDPTPSPHTDVGDVSDTPRTADAAEVDLDEIERDLAGVETALQRLSDGTYWTDEVTGAPIADHLLAADPTVRRA